MLLKFLFSALSIMSVAVLSIFQIILVVVLVILVLLQPPGSSSLSGFSNTQQGMIPVKFSENPLSRITAIVAGLFIINTLLLSGLYSKDVHKKSIAEKIILEKKQESEPTSVPFEN